VHNDTAAFGAVARHKRTKGGRSSLVQSFVYGRDAGEYSLGRGIRPQSLKCITFRGPCESLETVRDCAATRPSFTGHLIGTQVLSSPLLAELSAGGHRDTLSRDDLIHNCVGPIEISDIRADGNLQHLSIGGEYGDVGRQIPATAFGSLRIAIKNR